ncbi:MAG: hypothetical protein RL338_286 [Chloroflexota bacterium]|jgi:parvulin-like peptidyl-prolyl isomerase
MSLRPTPAARRPRQPIDHGARRTLYVNLFLVGSTILGVVLLVGAGVASYWSDHFSTVAVVNGETLTKDDLRHRVLADTWRLQRLSSNVQNALSAGRISQAQADAQFQDLQIKSQLLPDSSLEDLVDSTLRIQLAEREGVGVTDEAVDAALLKEATAPEVRKAWLISVTASGTSGDTAEDARKRAEQALADVRAGKAWEEVATAVSTDPSAANGGDLGYVSLTDEPDPFLTALFALEKDGITDVIEAFEGTYRIGRVTEIVASQVDPNYQQAIEDADIPIEAYRELLRGELARTALEDKITADAVESETVQRRVSRIVVQGDPSAAAVEQAKSSHILFSPGGDPSASGSFSSGDPAWAAAEASANTVYEQLVADPSRFAELATSQSDDKGSGANGGDLPWFAEADVDPAFGAAIFADGLAEGQILAPVRSSFGWHVIRYEGRRAAGAERIATLRTQASAPGADFAAIARESSEGDDATRGGDMGWIAKGQIEQELETAIFAAPIGSVSEVLESSSGWTIFLVAEEATRKPEGDQIATLRANAFRNWYDEQKAGAEITVEPFPTDLI